MPQASRKPPSAACIKRRLKNAPLCNESTTLPNGDPGYKCPGCGTPTPFRKGACIECLIAIHPFQVGDQVRRVNTVGPIGEVLYRYYNGYTLVKFPGKPIKGGALSNDSTYANRELVLVKRAAKKARKVA